MAGTSSYNNLVTFSVRVYQLLLNAYPTKFRQEYGSHMVQVFGDCCLRTIRQGGRNGMARLWAVTLLDFVRSVLEEHTQKETDMSKSTFIKLSGWAFVIGSFAFISLLSGSIIGSVISSILLAIGMLGLRARYDEDVGSLGRNILLVSIVAMVLAFATVPIFRDNESRFLLPFAGPAILLTGLTIFGLVALFSKPLPHVNWLPFFAGIWFPAGYFPVLYFTVMNNGAVPDAVDKYWTSASIIMSLQFLALCILGLIMQADVPEETAVPA